MNRKAWLFVLVCLLLARLSSAVAADVKDLRVLCVYSNCFEYQFASIVSGSGSDATLAFNSLGGRTVFAKVGEPLGDYVVESVTASNREVFNPTINASQTVKSGVATLRQKDEAIRLEMGRALPLPGYLALVAWLGSGEAAYVRVGDLVTGVDPQTTVTSVEPGAVSLASSGDAIAVPAVTSEERTRLLDLWRARRESEQRGREAAAISRSEAIRAEQQAEAQRPAVIVPRAPRRIMQITYDPLLITSMTKVDQVVAQYFTPVTKIRDGKPVTALETRQITVPMPQFQKFEYRGTILKYVD